MVEFNPNADFKTFNRKLDGGPKAEIYKQDGNFFVKNDDGSFEQVTRTRKGNLFHKAQFSRDGQGTSVEKSTDNVEVNKDAKAAALKAHLKELEAMKQASLEISAPSDTHYSVALDGVVVVNKGETPKSERKDDSIAFSGISSNEYVLTKTRGKDDAHVEERALTGADLAEVRDAIDNDGNPAAGDLAMNDPKPQGARDKFAGMGKEELLEFAQMYEDPDALNAIAAKFVEMGDKENAAKIAQKIQDLEK